MSMTDKEIEEGLAHLEHGFMTPSIWREQGAVIMEDGQEQEYPLSVARENGPILRKTAMDWWSELSASGYMDRTWPVGPFDTEREAAEYLVEIYADDIQDCPDCCPEEDELPYVAPCDSCNVATIQGVLCHETGCPRA